MTRLEVLEQRLAALETEVAELRAQIRPGEAALAQRAEHAGPAFPPPLARRAAPPSPPPPPPRARPKPPSPPAPAPASAPPAPPPRPRRELELSRLLGAFGLAVAGGIVTVLGIVFFFVLAANRGWIGPELRLAFGAAASVGVFAAGFWLRRRFGTTYAALAAVGAGIAGAYATLLAATALYGFVPELGALAAAAGIAAVATVVAFRWKEELVAALGLIGALLVPLMTLVEDGELTLVGTSFAALVFTATAAVALRQRWIALLVAGLVGSFPQIAGLVLQSEPTDWAVVWLAALFWALYVAVATVEQLTSRAERLDPLAVGVLLASAALAAGSSAQLFAGDAAGWSREGLALLVVSAAYLGLGAAFLRRARDLSTLFWAVGLTVGAVAAAELLSAGWLAVAWAGEAAVLAWVAEATRERRFRLASAGYLLLALAFTLGHEAPPEQLFEASAHPAAGVPSVVAVAIASLLVAWFSRRAPDEADDAVVVALHRARVAFVWLGGVLIAYAASLGILELSLWRYRFEHGQVAVTGFWALLAAALVETGGRLRRLDLSVAGLGLIAYTALKTVGYDHDRLDADLWPAAFLLAGAGALLCGVEYQRLGRDRWQALRAESAGAVVASALLGIFALVELADGDWNGIGGLGGMLVLLAFPYALLAAAVFRTRGLRDLATLLWALAFAILAAALFLLLAGGWLVLALTMGAALLAGLSLLAREPRLQIASAAYLATALAYTLVVETPPKDFFVASAHPGEGAQSLVLVALAALVLGLCTALPEARTVAFAGAGVLLLYALSLGILELAELVSGASVSQDFQRGHTAVSAAWGAIGLGLLTLGLLRRSRGLRLAGFALYGVSIAKLFLYDLTYSSPLGRPLSFLAVGILLLASGFFYQRLSERLAERE
ncbi:MAG TPA: DUF2339 domain-containing protein [Gaiellaceae bacterium]|nr:DUF2339 domain-containing protein [Gaiellaceae bacterium]